MESIERKSLLFIYRRWEEVRYPGSVWSVFNPQIPVVVLTEQLAEIQPQPEMLRTVAFLCVIGSGSFLKACVIKALSVVGYR